MDADRTASTRVGQTFGPYQLRSLLGRGGMGEVYEAFDTRRNRVVALKLLPKHASSDESYRARFQRESQLAARLQEPHVVPIHDFGEIDGTLFLDMRLVRGRDLRSVLDREGALSAQRAVAIVEQIAAALDAAHRDGLVHRDVKPENILIADNDFAYLADFGIASSETDSKLTATGMAIGSYSYMAPERFTDVAPTRSVDVYSLACVLFECLTRQKPFPRATVSALISAHLHEHPPRPSATAGFTLSGFDEVVRKAMAKNPDDRYATTGALAAAAKEALARPSVASNPFATAVNDVPNPFAAAGMSDVPSSFAATTARPPARTAASEYAATVMRPWQPEPAVSGNRAEYGLVEAPPRGGNRTVLIVVVLAAFLIGAVGLGAFALTRTDDSRDSTQAALTPSVPITTVDASVPVTLPPANPTTAAQTPPVTVEPEPPAQVTARQTDPSVELGVSVPMSYPACDGMGIVVLYSAVTPGAYTSEVQAALNRFPGAKYLRTDHSCPSLRQSLNGNPIYAVYRDGGYSRSALCSAVHAQGGDAYGRWLDTTSDPTVLVTC